VVCGLWFGKKMVCDLWFVVWKKKKRKKGKKIINK
jgi:hypothetical protein